MVAGVTCGAGMPYKLVRDRRLLRRQLSADRQLRPRVPRLVEARLFEGGGMAGAVVYEDPWLAGGHNGLSNAEDPREPQDPYPRVKELRETMREGGISDDVPIVMAGGVWYLREWDDWIDNPELGADRLPVRHAAAADPGKPDPRGVEGAADDARGGRHPAAPLLADRLLFLGGAQSVPAQSRGALGAPDRLFDRGRPAIISSSSTSA